MTETEALELKTIMKEAFSDVIVANKELIYNVFFEAFEDFYLIEAIKQGESSGIATREEVFEILEAK
jgi:hypothetical protein